jgi:pSer/pThr/pTyr-binding forkhead associated (FHA) protein
MYKSATPSFTRSTRQQPPIPARLVGIAGTVTGETFFLYADTTIGRGSRSDIILASPLLSRSHARFLFVIHHFVLQDLGAVHGTRVNGQLVQSVSLAHGDVIGLGDVEFRFELIGPTTSA